MDTRLLSAVIPLERATPETMGAVLKVLTWSLNVAYTGVYPADDWNGTPLEPTRMAKAGQAIAGGLSIAVIDIRGDWKFHAETWGVAAYNQRKCCHVCPAVRWLHEPETNGLLYNHWGPGCLWHVSRPTHQARNQSVMYIMLHVEVPC